MRARQALVRLYRPFGSTSKQQVLPAISIHVATNNHHQLQRRPARWLSSEAPPSSDLSKDASTAAPEMDLSKYNVRIEVKMPDMGEGGGKIIKWYKEPGDIVKREDVICDIETPDFSFGMETDDEHLAIMGEILVQAPSETIQDNEVICVLLHEEKKPK
jgi:hypothetical protein